MGRLGLWVSLCRISIFFRLKDRSQTWGSEDKTKTNEVLKFWARVTLLRSRHWGHGHTYLQYLITELVFGTKTPSESIWKNFTLPGIFLCCILGVVSQAQRCISKKDSIFITLSHPGNIVVLCSVFFLKLLFYLGCSKNYDKTSQASISSNEIFPSWHPEWHLQLPKESVPIAQLQGGRNENEEVLKTARKVITNIKEASLF